MASRKPFVPVYEESEDAIRTRMLAHPSLTGWRKTPGDFIYDAIAPDFAEVKRLQIGLDTTLRDVHAQYAKGPALDAILNEIGLSRELATPNKRVLQISADAGVVIPVDQKFTAVILDASGNPLQYKLEAGLTFTTGTTTLSANVTCMTTGTIGNLATGSSFILTPSIPGVRSIVDQGTSILGTEDESDDEAFLRYDFHVKHPDTGGNKNDLKRWAESVSGVGAARVLVRWNGNGTSKIVIVGADQNPASAPLVAAVQAYLDPGSSGLGEGKAPAGNRVTVVSANVLTIHISATVTYYTGVNQADVKAAFIQAVKTYMSQIVFTDAAISIAKVGSLLIGTFGVSNYSNLQLNGGTADIAVGTTQVAVIGTVTL